MPDYELVVITVLAVVIIVMAIVAVMHQNLLRAIIAYAIASAGLSALFFILASPYAGALELMVGAGLVAVLFLVALILAGGEEQEMPS